MLAINYDIHKQAILAFEKIPVAGSVFLGIPTADIIDLNKLNLLSF